MRGELVRGHASARRPSVLAAACVALVALACACVIAMPAHAAAAHVYDEAGILTADEISQLEAQADEVERTRGFSVNIVTVEDYKAVSTVSVFDAAVAKYKELSLDGSDGSGIVLMLSMKERDYSVAVNGDRETTPSTVKAARCSRGSSWMTSLTTNGIRASAITSSGLAFMSQPLMRVIPSPTRTRLRMRRICFWR